LFDRTVSIAYCFGLIDVLRSILRFLFYQRCPFFSEIDSLARAVLETHGTRRA